MQVGAGRGAGGAHCREKLRVRRPHGSSQQLVSNCRMVPEFVGPPVYSIYNQHTLFFSFTGTE